MFKLKKEIKKEYPHLGDREFNLIWSFIFEDKLMKDFIKNQFENKLNRLSR